MCFAVLIPALLHRLLCCLGYIIQKALWIYQNECTFLRFDESLQESLERPREMCYTEFVSSKIFFSFSPGEIHPEAVQTVKNSDFVIAQPAHTLVVAIEGCFACPCSFQKLETFRSEIAASHVHPFAGNGCFCAYGVLLERYCRSPSLGIRRHCSF